MSGKVRYQCKKCKSRTTNPLPEPPQLLPETKVADVRGSKFYVITSAVNDTPINQDAFETFKRVADHYAGKLLIIPGVYKNPDMMHQGLLAQLTWPKEIYPYLCNKDVRLNKSIIIRGATRIGYTLLHPLAGLDYLGGPESQVFGHPQVALQMIATPRNEMPKMLHTTGSVSEKNYGGSAHARKAANHHCFSAVIVELEGDKFWTRELHFDGEGAQDLDLYFTPEETKPAKISAIVFGDVHVKHLDQKTHNIVNDILQRYKPDYQVYHDVHDHNIGSHHNKGDKIFYLKKALQNDLSLRDELLLSCKFFETKENIYVIDSNHHRHLNRWFNDFNPRHDALNAPLYYELAELLQKSLATGDDANLYRLFLEKYLPHKNINFVSPNKAFLVNNIDLGQHGDRGPNGARGNIKTFARTGRKTMTGHTHVAGVEKGCYQVATLTLDSDYAEGYSSWTVTNGFIYQNSKRCLWHIVKSKLSPSMRK